MDGLLFDTEKLYFRVGQIVLRRRGHEFTEALQQRMMGRVGAAAMQQMIAFHQLDESAEALLAESEHEFTLLMEGGVDPMPGLSSWMDLLIHSGLPFGLATSSRRHIAERLLRDAWWASRLSFRLTGDDVSAGKPDPEMYLKAAGELGVAPSRMLVLEDSGNGTAAAVAAGAITVAVPSEATRGQDFSGAALIADSLADPRLAALISP